MRLTELCLPQLELSGHGRVINITSSSVREPIENLALSNAVRPVVIGWAKTLAREVGPKKITVNSIAPGRIETARLAEAFKVSGAALACLCSSDAVYEARAVSAAKALAAAGAGTIYLAGKPGADLAEPLAAAGVHGFLHAGGDLLALLNDALRRAARA